jgi:hypothetical protein
MEDTSMLARPEVWEEYKAAIVYAFEAQCEKRGRWPKAGSSARSETETAQAVDLTKILEIM